MFKKFETKNTYVDDLIAKATLKIQDLEVDSDEYEVVLERITKLQKIRNDERQAYQADLPNADTILTVAANLIGIALIINHERVNVITSKALPFVTRT